MVGHSVMARTAKLTPRQIECTKLVGRGLTEAEIAEQLGVSTETIKRHLKEARRSYGVDKSIQLVTKSLADGLLTLQDLL
jgi:LuxR family transcriptional regulator, quorum-sensing system regulator CciR